MSKWLGLKFSIFLLFLHFRVELGENVCRIDCFGKGLRGTESEFFLMNWDTFWKSRTTHRVHLIKKFTKPTQDDFCWKIRFLKKIQNSHVLYLFYGSAYRQTQLKRLKGESMRVSNCRSWWDAPSGTRFFMILVFKISSFKRNKMCIFRTENKSVKNLRST